MYINLVILLFTAPLTPGQTRKCDQTPPQAKILTPSENDNYYHLTIDTKSNDTDIYRPDQTYVLILESIGMRRAFRWFMITVEDAAVDENSYRFDNKMVDVGSLKTLDTNKQSRYSERCYNSVENSDNSDKYRVEIHWVSPKGNIDNRDETIRLRAMVAENEEIWYAGEGLTLVLKKDDSKPLDSPPITPSENCSLCSEARYEVIFRGQWSRMLHPRNYPSKPDENEYSNLIGASHAYSFTLWNKGDNASLGLKALAEKADVSVMEREIINAMSTDGGTRTLIRGKRRRHPHMSEPSHSLFRVDRIHHLFSVAIAIKPSPDWFLGTSRFELCTSTGWLEESTIRMYPWDAGVRDGISYEVKLCDIQLFNVGTVYNRVDMWASLASESHISTSYINISAKVSPTSVTDPGDTVDRVAVGSFDKQSPFYQMNLNDLKPFAHLQVRRLEVYPLTDNCDEEGTNVEDVQEQGDQAENLEEPVEEPLMLPLERDMNQEDCLFSEWTEWSECVPDSEVCGRGTQIRTREKVYTENPNSRTNMVLSSEVCRQSSNGALTQFQECYVNCV